MLSTGSAVARAVARPFSRLGGPSGHDRLEASLGERVENARQRARLCAARSPAPSSHRRRAAAARPPRGAVGQARRDRLGRRSRLPVAPPMAPQQRAPAARAGEPQRGGVERPRRAGGRASASSRCARSMLSWARAMSSRTCGGVSRSRLRWRWQCRPICVAGGGDLAGQRRVAAHLLADEEERRAHALGARGSRARPECPAMWGRRRR